MNLGGHGSVRSTQEDVRQLKAVARGYPHLAPDTLTATDGVLQTSWAPLAQHSKPPCPMVGCGGVTGR